MCYVFYPQTKCQLEIVFFSLFFIYIFVYKCEKMKANIVDVRFFPLFFALAYQWSGDFLQQWGRCWKFHQTVSMLQLATYLLILQGLSKKKCFNIATHWMNGEKKNPTNWNNVFYSIFYNMSHIYMLRLHPYLHTSKSICFPIYFTPFFTAWIKVIHINVVFQFLRFF